MKKKLLAVLLLLVMCLEVSCQSNQPLEENPESGDSQSDFESGDMPQPSTPVTGKKSYLPESVRCRMENFLLEELYYFSAYSSTYAPYAMQDVYNICNGKLCSITVPVYQVLRADANGQYSFTVHVVSNTYDGLKEQPLRSYRLMVSGEKYGFSEKSTVGRLIQIDLSAYDIVLSQNETLAFFAPSDTLIPAYMNTTATEARVYLSDAFPQTMGFYSAVGTEKLAFNDGNLLYDFEFEREYTDAENLTYSEQTAYEKLVESLRDRYSGKYVSVLGDSISTFGLYSNNVGNNATTGENEVYYPNSLSQLVSWKNTYWGRLIRDLDMKLCVNNSRSGSAVYGRKSNSYTDSSVFRATELDNDNGTPYDGTDDISPDVILFYMGVNDISISSPYGDLTKELKKTAQTNYDLAVGNWWKSVLEKTSNGQNCTIGGTVTTFEQAYALTVYKMIQAYPNAEIYCLNIQGSKSNNAATVADYNLCIKAIASYFGVTLVDQVSSSGITRDSFHAYMRDANCLHPNAGGHYLMTKVILETMLQRKQPF